MGGVAQLARALACRAKGYEFEPRRPRHTVFVNIAVSPLDFARGSAAEQICSRPNKLRYPARRAGKCKKFMTRFFIYTRKSSEDKEKQILSIEAQLQELRDSAKKENLEIIDEFVETKTAKEPGRPVFNEMLSRIEKCEAEGILSWHPDRLARNSVDGGRIIYLIDTGKIRELKFPTFWFEPTSQGKFMLNIAFGQSKYYIDNLSENVKRGLRQKLRRGEWPGQAPIGYVNNLRNHTIEIDREKAPIIRNLFKAYTSDKYTLKELANLSLSLGLISQRKRKGLAVAVIQRMLQNKFYLGLFTYRGETYEGKHKPIINKTTFDKVQQILEGGYDLTKEIEAAIKEKI